MQFFSLLFLAVIVEGIVEWIKTIYQKGKFQWPTLLALAAGILVCIAADVDLFVLVGVPLHIPFLGAALTGILISRGSNYIHDLVSKLGSQTNA